MEDHNRRSQSLSRPALILAILSASDRPMTVLEILCCCPAERVMTANDARTALRALRDGGLVRQGSLRQVANKLHATWRAV